ncbi:MAG TPA: CoA-transferase, partial [Dermatophilaceae bacterium]
VFRKAARNFNPVCAMAARIAIAEVEHLVEPGELDPDSVHLPGVYVDRVVPLTAAQTVDKRIERLTTRPLELTNAGE